MASANLFNSKICQEFSEKLYSKLIKEKVYFHPKTKEFSLYDKEFKRIYFYDFVIPSKKIIIEFNGDYWHSEKNPKFNKQRENRKIEYAKLNGWNYYIVWESEFKENKDICIENALKFIGESEIDENY